MADGTHIEWTDATWNPITGCSVVSPGCTNCYAMRLAGTRLQHHPSRAGLTQDSKAGPVWTGEVRLNEEWLKQPLQWRRPRKIFVCAHGDLFHDAVPDDWIDKVFAVMALAPQHIFQVLTKRPERMRAWFAKHDAAHDHSTADRVADQVAVLLGRSGAKGSDRVDGRWKGWPLPNVWLGVSAEDQPRLNERWRWLRDTPAALKWLSLEPLLELVDLIGNAGNGPLVDGVPTTVQIEGSNARWFVSHGAPRIDWVVVGGESGPGSRPMHPAWVRTIRNQCVTAGVPFFFKQQGDWLTEEHARELGTSYRAVHTFPDGLHMVRVGKGKAGHLIDGVEYRAFPAITHAA